VIGPATWLRHRPLRRVRRVEIFLAVLALVALLGLVPGAAVVLVNRA